jgi:protein-S-isoprenylcysteine O-methyltransferase Ste14
MVILVIPYLILKGSQVGFSDLGGWVMFISGSAVFLSGIMLMFWCVMIFIKKGSGTLAPWAPPKKFVTSGPYLHTRNPMILGVLIAIIGETIALRSRFMLIYAAMVFIINTAYFILSEEPGLEKRFGESYREYKKNVPRWGIRVKAYKSGK